MCGATTGDSILFSFMVWICKNLSHKQDPLQLAVLDKKVVNPG